MVAQKKDIFKTPLPAPLVGTGSTSGELEKRASHIHKHSVIQEKEQPSMKEQKKRNTATAEAKVRDLSRKSIQVLYQLRTVFPFDFFPDTITVNANKIDIVQSFFFFSSNTTSVPIRDIANVEVETTPFFATIKLINIRAPMRPISISFLKKDEAKRAKNIIDGLLVATEQGADVSSIEPKKFLPQIEKLGQSFG